MIEFAAAEVFQETFSWIETLMGGRGIVVLSGVIIAASLFDYWNTPPNAKKFLEAASQRSEYCLQKVHHLEQEVIRLEEHVGLMSMEIEAIRQKSKEKESLPTLSDTTVFHNYIENRAT
jgi:hypothetical protein